MLHKRNFRTIQSLAADIWFDMAFFRQRNSINLKEEFISLDRKHDVIKSSNAYGTALMTY